MMAYQSLDVAFDLIAQYCAIGPITSVETPFRVPVNDVNTLR
jgi:hypothetical protein